MKGIMDELGRDNYLCHECDKERIKMIQTTKNEKAKGLISQEDIMKVLDTCYDKALNGIPKVSPSIEEFADDYLCREPSTKAAAKAMLKNQVTKCTVSGFITGFGGAITLPVSVPANLGSVFYVQMRMIACTAYMAGYDLKSDQVQTLIYACLAGVSVSEIMKKTGVRIGEKVAIKAIEKIPGKVCIKINQKVGFRLVSKFGEKGIINLWKLVPGVGAVVNGGFDYAETKVIAKRAYKFFIEGDYSSAGDDIEDADIIEVEE